jgi:hypothetical protein
MMREIEHDIGHRWAKTSVVDEMAIDHERDFGAVLVTGDVVRIRVAQRVDFDLLAEPVAMEVSAVRIALGEMFEMTPSQTREVARRLMSAASFADEVHEPTRPRLVAKR